MKTKIPSIALAAVILVMSVSGCASFSLQSTSEIGQLPKGKQDSVEMQFGIARLLERQGKLTEARKAYLEILSSQSHTQSLHRLGVTDIRQNRVDAGLKLLSQAVAAGDASAELLGDYGYAQFLAGDLSASEKTLKQAVTLDPSQKRNVNNLAIVVGKQDRLEESLLLFRQAGPEAEALANLAFIQSQSEDLSKARDNYSKALDLDPKLKIAAVGLMEVDKHINAKNETNQAIEPKLQETSPQEIAAEQTFLEETPVAQKLPVEKPAEKSALEQNASEEKSQVKRVSWNQPATKIPARKSSLDADSDRVLAKILTPATVAVESNDDIKTAQRENSDKGSKPKASSREDLLSLISKLNVSDAASEDSTEPRVLKFNRGSDSLPRLVPGN